MSLARLLALLLLLPALVGAGRGPGMGDVSDVRTWSHPDYTRVVVELTQPVDAQAQHLAADPVAARPERLYLDLPDIWVGRRFDDGIAVGDGLLSAVRIGQNTLETARLVIDLQRYASHRMLILSNPDRVVVDVYAQREQPEKLRWPMNERAARLPSQRLSMPLRRVQTVIVDPGHGGTDPGAIGLGGIREKEVNLRIATLLSERLESRGFRVVQTRVDDRTLDLEARTVIAEAASGDLFVSLHANSAPRHKTRGIEIYYLDEGYERHSLSVAARENGVQRSEMDSLQKTLARMRASEASDHSARLANRVHEAVFRGAPRRGPKAVDLGVKQAPFYVLFLASMPSILVETGFLTNRQDLRLLKSDEFLAGLADQIAEGLMRYRSDGSEIAKLGDP
jgi:N-acetylmuramoyl-L-alanine amidase